VNVHVAMRDSAIGTSAADFLEINVQLAGSSPDGRAGLGSRGTRDFNRTWSPLD
jgi:hypothetical protein